MADRRLPVRPRLADLEREAGAESRDALARSYGVASWERLEQAVRLADAIWEDDLAAVRALVEANPALVHEHVLIRPDSNWGPPMSYAANLGRNEIIRYLHSRGARDFPKAVGRAALQGKVGTVKLLLELTGGRVPDGLTLAGPAYTLNVEGTAALLAVGIRPVSPSGVDSNAMEHLLGTDSRNPEAKHRILEMWTEHGFDPPDTPVMALHRGRKDLLEAHFARDPGLPTRTFGVAEIYPHAPACARDRFAAQGTPVHGTTLLHLAVYFDDPGLVEWLLDRGMDPNVPSAVDEDGFGGYTPLHSAMVCQHNFWVNYGRGRPDDAHLVRLLLDRGADPNARASIRSRLEEGHGGGPIREVRDATPLAWAERFHAPIFVSREAIRLVEARGGGR